MKEVAERARVSLGTLYRYFASKDHLLAEALLVWGSELGRRLREAPPRGADAAERVANVFRRMARGVEEEPSWVSSPGTALARPARLRELRHLGSDSWKDRTSRDGAGPSRRGRRAGHVPARSDLAAAVNHRPAPRSATSLDRSAPALGRPEEDA
jgi:AcrR family transcriptional regulator